MMSVSLMMIKTTMSDDSVHIVKTGLQIFIAIESAQRS